MPVPCSSSGMSRDIRPSDMIRVSSAISEMVGSWVAMMMVTPRS